MTTSTKVDLKGADVTKIDDSFFTKEKQAKGSQSEKFFAEGSKVSINNW